MIWDFFFQVLKKNNVLPAGMSVCGGGQAGRRAEEDPWRGPGAHMCSRLPRAALGVKGDRGADSGGSDYFSICLRRKEREEIKEGRKIISLCGDQMHPGVLSDVRSSPWAPEAPERGE